MKKHGFTLAEVLVTLGIIGVVAALAMPLFVQKTQTAKTGPALGKAIVTFENGAKAVMQRAEADSLLGVTACTNGGRTCTEANGNNPSTTVISSANANGEVFWKNISDFVNGSLLANNDLPANLKGTNNFGFLTTDGIMFAIPRGVTTGAQTNDIASKGVLCHPLIIDINGNKEPNTAARDQFYFFIMEDGSIRPYGATDAAGILPALANGYGNNAWNSAQNGCQANAVPTGDGAKMCAGHIVENDFKVLYK